MQTTKLLISTLSAWTMAFIYDFIDKITGHEIRVLPYAGLVVMVVGLYAGLYANNKTTKEEEA